jgi:hypothetical protein
MTAPLLVSQGLTGALPLFQPVRGIVRSSIQSWTDVTIRPRLLSDREFRATFTERMVDIKSREDVIHPYGVIDLKPYLRAVEGEIAPLELLPDAEPSAVYQSSDGRFEQVLYPCNQSNVYLVVIVEVPDDRVYGHIVLDLANEYGLPPGA